MSGLNRRTMFIAGSLVFLLVASVGIWYVLSGPGPIEVHMTVLGVADGNDDATEAAADTVRKARPRPEPEPPTMRPKPPIDEPLTDEEVKKKRGRTDLPNGVMK